MKRAATPAHTRIATVLALVAVIALLAAPLCAPLCAGKICASAMPSSDTRHESCHEMANIPPNGPDQYVATNKSCGAADFSAVLVASDEQSLLLQAAGDHSAPVALDHSNERALQSFHASPGRWSIHRVPLKSKDFLPLTTILRI
jgi:hypothetical protein